MNFSLQYRFAVSLIFLIICINICPEISHGLVVVLIPFCIISSERLSGFGSEGEGVESSLFMLRREGRVNSTIQICCQLN